MEVGQVEWVLVETRIMPQYYLIINHQHQKYDMRSNGVHSKALRKQLCFHENTFSKYHVFIVYTLLIRKKVTSVTVNFCSKCGMKLSGQVNFCPTCGNNVNGEQKTEKILSINHSTKTNIFNLVAFLLIGAYSVQYFIQLFIYGFKWETTTKGIQAIEYDDTIFMLALNFCLFILLIIVFSIFFKKTFVSRTFVKVIFLTNLIGAIGFSLHILYTTFLYVNIHKGIEVIYGYNNEYAGEFVREILKFKLGFLVVLLFVMSIFIFIILKRYFKKQSIHKFSSGIKTLVGKPFRMDKLINAFKQFE